MPPLISGSRVPIGGGAVGTRASMKNAPASRDSKTFEGAGGRGRGRGGPQQKGTVANAGGARVGGHQAKVATGAKGLEATKKSGRNVSAKPQPA